MPFDPTLQPSPSPAGPSNIDDPGPANELVNFPAGATLSPLMDAERAVHVSERVGSDGIVVIATFYDLVDSKPMTAITRDVPETGATSLVVTGRPRSTSGDTFQSKISYAKKVGGASDILSPSPELATLLGVGVPRDPDYNRLYNGLLLVVDGAIVWRAVADARKPEAPHDISGLMAAIARYTK